MDKDKKNITYEDVARLMNTPEMKNTAPEQLINKLAGMLGLDDIEPVSEEETARIRQEYYQVVVLSAEEWTFMPKEKKFVQIVSARLKKMPEGCHLVADILIDKSDIEEEYFNNYISGMELRGKTMVFYSDAEIPVDLTIGLKVVVNETGNTLYIPDDQLYKAKKT